MVSPATVSVSWPHNHVQINQSNCCGFTCSCAVLPPDAVGKIHTNKKGNAKDYLYHLPAKPKTEPSFTCLFPFGVCLALPSPAIEQRRWLSGVSSLWSSVWIQPAKELDSSQEVLSQAQAAPIEGPGICSSGKHRQLELWGGRGETVA